MESFIYILTDPRNGDVRYVGVSNDPAFRFKQHKKDRCMSDAKRAWFNDLSAEDLEPDIAVIDAVPDGIRLERERYWINFYKECGENLVNVNDNLPPKTEDKVRFYVDIPHEAHRRLRYAAGLKGITMKQILMGCIEQLPPVPTEDVISVMALKAAPPRAEGATPDKDRDDG